MADGVTGYFLGLIYRRSLMGFDPALYCSSVTFSMLDLEWHVNFSSTYDGNVAVTQLILGKYGYDSGIRLVTIWENQRSGVPWLDKEEFYYIHGSYASQPARQIAALTDAPDLEMNGYIHSANVEGSFKDYIRFKPGLANNDANIYVTLGIVSWYCYGIWAAYVPGDGIFRNDTPAPAAPVPSNEFPLWPATLDHGILHP